MENKGKRKRIYWIVGIVAVVAVLAGGFLVVRSRQQAAQAEADSQETVAAFIGDLSASVTASGTVSPRREATVSASVPGLVEQVNVRIGDHVAAGDVLVQLDTDDLAMNMAIAGQNVKLKEASLADLLVEPTEAEIAAAETAVSSAQAALDDLLNGPTAEEIAAQEANLQAAEANVWSSSAQLNQTQNSIDAADIAAAEASLAAAEANLKSVELQYTRNPDPDDYQANAALAQAREQVAAAQSALDNLLAGPDDSQLGKSQAGLSASAAQRDATAANLNKLISDPTAAEIAGKQAQLAQAQAALDDLLDGATAEKIAGAEAEVAQAKINLEDAQAAFESAAITAPFAGVVTAVYYSEGEFATGPVLEIVDDATLEVILEVDEVDVGSLQLGQPAVITLETWPDDKIDSEITLIAPGAKTSPGSSLIIYEVHLSLGETSLPVLVGMTANADLITDEKQDVLLVPNQAINADRSKGTYAVNLLVDGEIQEIPITIGMRDNQNTEVTSGLKPGDVLVVGNVVPRSNPFADHPGAGE